MNDKEHSPLWESALLSLVVRLNINPLIEDGIFDVGQQFPVKKWDTLPEI